MRNILIMKAHDGKTLYIERLFLKKGTIYAHGFALTTIKNNAATFSAEAVGDAMDAVKLLMGSYPKAQPVRKPHGIYYEAYA
jgi:hypothetical protein